MQLAVLIRAAVVVAVFLLLVGAALVDNKVKYGFWRASRHQGPVRPPLPYEDLTGADRDAWLGGSGGAP